MAKAKAKAQPESYKEAKAKLTAEYLAKGLKFKEVKGKKKVKADSENPVFREYKAKLAELRRPAGVE